MQDRTLSFGRYRLEPRGGLLSGTRPVRLTPKALALLGFMAGRPNEVITKEELFAAVWPEVSVGDAALVTCIQELRKALGDDARQPHDARAGAFVEHFDLGVRHRRPPAPRPLR